MSTKSDNENANDKAAAKEDLGGGGGGGHAQRRISRRRMIGMIAVVTVAGGIVFARRKVMAALSRFTHDKAFDATPPLVPHDPAKDKQTIYVARNGASPADNIDSVFEKLGGIGTVVSANDLVIIKVSAQWWNQGMTNVAAVKRTIERILELPGFKGEIVVFENTHFRLKDGSGLSRAWTRPSERNVDVPGWNKMGDLITHFANSKAPVSFVGLVDGGPSNLAHHTWHDPSHEHGVYGGDGRGPIGPGEDRDGYHWDFNGTFRLKRSWVDQAQTPLTWPVFTSPHSGLVIDLKDGIFRREGGKLTPVKDRKLTWINMTTANEHQSTGFTGCCKSAMGIVDMSAGYEGSDPRVRDYQSVHYFGEPSASWRMAGPLAHFARKVRTPDLYISVAEWVAVTPTGGLPKGEEARLVAASAHHTKTIVAGKDAVAVDSWLVRNVIMPIGGSEKAIYNLDDPDARVVKFLRYYREVFEGGTLDPSLVTVV